MNDPYESLTEAVITFFWELLIRDRHNITHKPAIIYLFKGSNRNIKRCEIYSKLTTKTAERDH